MGLIKTAIKYGALFGVAKTGFDALGQHNQQQQQQQQVQPQNQQYGPIRDASGYLHQPYCNGQCGQRCHLNVENRNVNEGYASGQEYGKATI